MPFFTRCLGLKSPFFPIAYLETGRFCSFTGNISFKTSFASVHPNQQCTSNLRHQCFNKYSFTLKTFRRIKQRCEDVLRPFTLNYPAFISNTEFPILNFKNHRKWVGILDEFQSLLLHNHPDSTQIFDSGVWRVGIPISLRSCP